jgi:hypothetical protein
MIPVTLLSLWIDSPFLCGSAIMLEIINEFYAVRVEDLKPLCGHQIAEVCDSDEIIYLISADRKDIILTDVSVCVPPQRDKRTDNYQTAA